jgi:hypothetical protein
MSSGPTLPPHARLIALGLAGAGVVTVVTGILWHWPFTLGAVVVTCYLARAADETEGKQ